MCLNFAGKSRSSRYNCRFGLGRPNNKYNQSQSQDYDIVVSGTSPTGDFDHIRLMFHADYAGSKMIAIEESPEKFDYEDLAALIDKSAQTLDSAARIEINKRTEH